MLQIDTAAPTVSLIATSGAGITNGDGDLNAGKDRKLTRLYSSHGYITDAALFLLNDGGTAGYTSGSGSNALTFSYTVAAGQNTSDLLISSYNLPAFFF